MAIVLVIIGIILGAVLKGGDLIDNARAKQFVNNIKSWQISLTAYYDRKGRYPGDAKKNGIMCDEVGDSTPAVDIPAAKFTGLPQNSSGVTINSFVMGQNTYYVLMGHDGGTPKKNIFKVCLADDCSVDFNLEALKMAESFNTAMAGSADATGLVVYGVTTAGTVVNTDWAVTAAGTKATNSDWLSYETGATKVKGMVYVVQ
jgi:hypothetical protein